MSSKAVHVRYIPTRTKCHASRRRPDRARALEAEQPFSFCAFPVGEMPPPLHNCWRKGAIALKVPLHETTLIPQSRQDRRPALEIRKPCRVTVYRRTTSAGETN